MLGLLYLLVTLLFGPIKSLARWLAQQAFVARYQRWVARLPPGIGLALALLSLSLLEVSKIVVLLSFRHFGLAAAIIVVFCTKVSLGYFAHLTWQAARPQVIATYAWAARIDAWVLTQLEHIRGFRNRWLVYLRTRPWYVILSGAAARLRQTTTQLAQWIKAKLA
jgi:hypothetical protein